MAIRYLAAALGCGAFALVYAQFSHGVYSPYMTFMFLIPLVGGALPALVCLLAKKASLPVVARQSWAFAVASLTVASCLRGIFDIAGTASPYLPAYFVFAAIFACVGLVAIFAVQWRAMR